MLLRMYVSYDDDKTACSFNEHRNLRKYKEPFKGTSMVAPRTCPRPGQATRTSTAALDRNADSVHKYTTGLSGTVDPGLAGSVHQTARDFDCQRVGSARLRSPGTRV